MFWEKALLEENPAVVGGVHWEVVLTPGHPDGSAGHWEAFSQAPQEWPHNSHGRGLSTVVHHTTQTPLGSLGEAQVTLANK